MSLLGELAASVVAQDATELVESSDPLKRELELTCTRCGERLCDVEPGDSLSALVGMAEDHAHHCPRRADP